MKVSALVLTRNRPKELLRCIESIRNQSIKPAEILVLDNGSEREINLDEYRPKLRDCIILKSDQNLGCPAGRNYLIDKSSGDLLLFVDDDGILAQDALANGLKYFEEMKKLAVVTFRIIDDKTNKIRDGFAPDIAPFYHHTFGGGSCIIKKEALLNTGLYPTDFLRQGEENDLAIRMIDVGYKIIYAPDCILFHPEIKTTPEVFINSQLSTIASSWKLLPLHYALMRTVLNYFRLNKYLEDVKLNFSSRKEITDIIKSAYSQRKRVKYTSYFKWLFLVFLVKVKKINVRKTKL